MLNNIGLPGLLLIAVVVLVLFGRGKISSLMGEVGKGITSFKKGVAEGTKEVEDGTEEAKDAVTDAPPRPKKKTRPDLLDVGPWLDRASAHWHRGAHRRGAQGLARHVPCRG
jgi:sec-independent protein translocase protein TatA